MNQSQKSVKFVLLGAGAFMFILIALYIGAGCFRSEGCSVFKDQNNLDQEIKSFEDCAARGFPVMESYPRQCRAGSVTFIERLTVPQHPDVRVDNVKVDQIISSPFTVIGQARGRWYFEASFPIEITDSKGLSLGIGVAQAQAEWMTDNFVPFSAIINFSEPATANGFMILHKDNPSGLPENDDELKIPIKFGDVNALPELQ